jgi:nicotinate-nucleotide adenylyltransferase
MRIGLFGGAFDPIHVAHLALAERVRDDAGLDRVLFVPSYKPPHKAERELTRFDTRCDMVALAITGQPAFAVEPIEKELPPPSFTLGTLRALQSNYPDDELSLILGADSLLDLPTWHEPRAVAVLAELLVVPRPGVAIPTADELAASLGAAPGEVRLRVVPCPLLEVASRELRQRVAAGRSIRYLVPRAVEEFVRERGLYRVWA